MSRHVDLEIVDFVAGRLPESRQREVEEHLKKCDQCMSDVTWARKLRDRALQQGLRHVDAMRIVELASGPLSATEIEREHLASCEQCRRELDWAGKLQDAGETTEDDVGGDTVPLGAAAKARKFPVAWAWAGLAVAAVVIALIFVPRGPGIDYPGLARIEPLPVHISRSASEAGSFEESRLLGLDSYASGDYAAARTHLGRAAEMEPDNGEILLYLGSAELLAGEVGQALGHLERALERSPDGAVKDEAAWQLANAALADGRPTAAVTILRKLAEFDGRRGDDARALLELLN